MALCGHLVWTSILGEEVQTVGRTGHETFLRKGIPSRSTHDQAQD